MVGAAGCPGSGAEFAHRAFTATPRDIVARLNAEIVKVLQAPDVRERLAAQGFEVRTSTPEQMGTYIRSELAKWAPIVKESGVKSE